MKATLIKNPNLLFFLNTADIGDSILNRLELTAHAPSKNGNRAEASRKNVPASMLHQMGIGVYQSPFGLNQLPPIEVDSEKQDNKKSEEAFNGKLECINSKKLEEMCDLLAKFRIKLNEVKIVINNVELNLIDARESVLNASPFDENRYKYIDKYLLSGLIEGHYKNEFNRNLKRYENFKNREYCCNEAGLDAVISTIKFDIKEVEKLKSVKGLAIHHLGPTLTIPEEDNGSSAYRNRRLSF